MNEDKMIMDDDILFQFDGDERVSFADGSHNTIVLGTTGSGKTTSLLFPALSKMIKAGFAGLVVDVKGNMANYVRRIANEHGRLDDIVEFGPGPAAKQVNVFWNVPMYDVEKMFRTIFQFDSMPEIGKYNSLFYEEGLQKIMDCLELYLIMCRKMDMDFRFGVFNRIINEYQMAQDVYAHYRKALHDPNNIDEQKLVGRIDGDPLHYILQPGAKRNRAWDEQTSYRMHTIRTCIERFMRFPVLIRNFLGNTKDNFNIPKRIYDDKQIVVLRLATELGTLGENLARWIMREYYQAVYRNGKNLPTGEYTFCVADEVQDFYSSNRNDPLNDNSFVAKCREFNCINIYGTQSISAMMSRAERGMSDCAALIGNCNTRIFLYSDDPNTKYLAPENLQSLETLAPGMANLVKYDSSTREHQSGTVTIKNMFQSLQDLFVRQADKVPDTVAIMQCPDLTDEEKKKEFEVIMADCKRLTTRKLDNFDDCVDTNSEGLSFQISNFEKLDESNSTLSVAEKNAANLIKEFPGYFSTNAKLKHLIVPSGWIGLVRESLLLAQNAELYGKILKFKLSHFPYLMIVEENDSEIFSEAMNSNLKKTKNCCMICGEKMNLDNDDEGEDDEDENLYHRRNISSKDYQISCYCVKCLSDIKKKLEIKPLHGQG